MTRQPKPQKPTAVVPKLWPGETLVCLGAGPSLSADDVAFVRGKARVIVINTSYQIAPWADVLYACDARWWEWHKGVPDFAGLKYALEARAAQWPNVTILRNAGIDGLELNPNGLRTGKNGGYQAINLAVHLGASRIVLLGYDMKPSSGGAHHWHAKHPTTANPPYSLFLRSFPTIVEPLKKIGVEVINCSRKSALEVFPRKPLADVFTSSAEVAA